MLFFESGDTEVFKADRNKLFASSEKQIDNHTLMPDMFYSYMSVMCTYHHRGVFKNIFWCGCCLKLDVHKEKYISKKSHLSGGMIDMWYLEWQKQEKYIELTIRKLITQILDSSFKLGEIKFIHIMLHCSFVYMER